MSPQTPAVPADAELPSHTRLAEELLALRRPGLAGLRRIRPEALAQAAASAGYALGSADEAAAIEALLEAAVRRLAAAPGPADGPGPADPPAGEANGGRRADPLGRAAAHTFGLLPGRRGTPAPDRRKAAAAVYGVTAERFRRGQEQEVIAELAGAVLALAREAVAGPAGRKAPEPLPDPPARAAGPALPPAALRRITVHVSSMELLRDIDILVSSENTHMEMSKTFRPTVSGALRRAAAIRNAGGEITDDVLTRELADWMRAHGRTGLPVQPGIVVPTSPGALAKRGVRRIYHAAVVRPLGDGVRYQVDPQTLADAVAATFARANAERDAYDPPLASICFPMLGAGQGGLPPVKAARWLRWAVQEELSRHPDWTVHFVARRPELARLLTDASSAP
ncbi:Appr-1-p processing protein [Streptomyces venezuelae]|uniref:Appr-1-p processing protein n=1 Tax=Streptomyces venezuelae TaxID=54571 RepID=A0A5P2CZR2_STRVZ|nr:Appr-1-p processing protein [Streptomyces venezuelae]QES47248.1 Appr-1-p processing protein [Streptomyces venezuelae]